jgi:hypothetical protein
VYNPGNPGIHPGRIITSVLPSPTYINVFLLSFLLSEYKEHLPANKEKIKPDAKVDLVECSFDSPPGPEQICELDAVGLFQGDCTKENNYGYRNGTPCIAIKLNKVSIYSSRVRFRFDPLKPRTAVKTQTCIGLSWTWACKRRASSIMR